MPTLSNHNQHYLLVEKAISYLLDHHTEQPELSEIAAYVGLSEFYFQRLFVEWAGISPKRFLQFLTREYMKNLLDQGYSVLEATYQAGLSGGGRSHELFVKSEAITPAQYRNIGKDLRLTYGFHPSPFGEYLLACSDKGICHLSFVGDSAAQTEQAFREEWALASIERNQSVSESFHQQLFGSSSKQQISLLLRGTPFQIQVWQALLQIPFACVSNYEQIAAAMGKHSATRATASAIAKNKIAYLIPCHRVIRKIGESGEFRWGKHRKKLLLAYEGAVSNN
tara:strand:+ start:3055 stop:3897 length:843 start_codon:yes stop_codon:yes gene_type:complete